MAYRTRTSARTTSTPRFRHSSCESRTTPTHSSSHIQRCRELLASRRLIFTEATTSVHGEVLSGRRSIVSNPSLTSFTIYPTSAYELRVNRLLWRVARTGQYPAACGGDELLQCPVIALALPTALNSFLSSASWQEVRTAIVDFLVLLRHQLGEDNDQVGLRVFDDELYPPILQEVLAGTGIFERNEPEGGRRAELLEKAVQLCFLTPWSVGVWGSSVVIEKELHDTREYTSQCGKLDFSRLGGLTTRVSSATVEERDLREFLTDHTSYVHAGRRKPVCTHDEIIIDLWRDWRLLHGILQCTYQRGRRNGKSLKESNDCSEHPDVQDYNHKVGDARVVANAVHATNEGLERIVHSGSHCNPMKTALGVLMLCNEESSWIGRLPSEVVSQVLVPWVVRDGVDRISAQRTRVQSLRAYLHMSSKAVEDMCHGRRIAPRSVATIAGLQ